MFVCWKNKYIDNKAQFRDSCYDIIINIFQVLIWYKIYHVFIQYGIMAITKIHLTIIIHYLVDPGPHLIMKT